MFEKVCDPRLTAIEQAIASLMLSVNNIIKEEQNNKVNCEEILEKD